jgi:hypothetical protein
MSDTKFLGFCILLAAFIISGTIVWSTNASQRAATVIAPANGPAQAAAPMNASPSVTISGPVTLAPFSAPIPVIISTPDGNPIVVKDASEKKWVR